MICALFCPYVMASVRKEKVGLKKVLYCACLTDGDGGGGGGGGVKSYLGKAHIHGKHFKKRLP